MILMMIHLFVLRKETHEMNKPLMTLAMLSALGACASPALAFECKDDPLKTQEERANCEEPDNFFIVGNNRYNEYFKGVLRRDKPRCSDNVKPGTVVLTNPPTYNCEDLKYKDPATIRAEELEKRVKELEEKIKELECQTPLKN